MEERTRTRLTKFSRLWPIPLVLFIVLCVVALFACINQQKDILALAGLGTILMFIIMLCQLVTSIIVRHWWYVVGTIVSIAISIFAWLCSIVLMAAGQYRPPIREETHDISDIMLIIANQEDPGELLSYIRTAWEHYIQEEEYPGEFLLMDDYLMYVDRNEDEERGFVWTDTTEFRSWDFESSSDKLVALAHRDYTNGELACGQYSGLSFYIFDGDTIEWIPDDTLGIEFPEINGIVVCWLSGDADITLSASNPEEGTNTKSFDWDGNKFVIKEDKKEP